MSDDFEVVQREPDISQFAEFMKNRRRALIQQARALEAQRSAIMTEINQIEKMTRWEIKQVNEGNG